MGVLDVVKPGVLTGSEAKKLFAYAKENNFANKKTPFLFLISGVFYFIYHS